MFFTNNFMQFGICCMQLHNVLHHFSLLICSIKRRLCPELYIICWNHFLATTWTSMTIPFNNIFASTLQTESIGKSLEWWCSIANNTADHQRLNSAAVRAAHHDDMLTHEAVSLVYLSFIATTHTFIFIHPCHGSNRSQDIVVPPWYSHDGDEYIQCFVPEGQTRAHDGGQALPMFGIHSHSLAVRWR